MLPLNLDVYKILVVEDEQIPAHVLKQMLHEMGFSAVTLSFKYEDALSKLQVNSFDLALLDINLSTGTEGIKLAKVCNDLGIKFMFISSYSDTAMLDKAISHSPLAYLTKPYQKTAIYSALKIALPTIEPNLGTLKFKDTNELIQIPITEIEYVQAENIYVEIYTSNNKYLVRETLSRTLEMLPSSFVRIHRSFIINTKKVIKMEATKVYLNSVELPVSKTYYDELRDLF